MMKQIKQLPVKLLPNESKDKGLHSHVMLSKYFKVTKLKKNQIVMKMPNQNELRELQQVFIGNDFVTDNVL